MVEHKYLREGPKKDKNIFMYDESNRIKHKLEVDT